MAAATAAQHDHHRCRHNRRLSSSYCSSLSKIILQQPVSLVLLVLFVMCNITPFPRCSNNDNDNDNNGIANILRGGVSAAESSSTLSTPSLNKPFQPSFRHLPHEPCVTLYTRTGRVGCGTATRDASTGRILRWSNDLSVPVVTTNTAADGGGGVTLVMTDVEFTASNMKNAMTNIGNLAGVLVTNSSTPLAIYSNNNNNNSNNNKNYYTSPASSSPQGINTPSYNMDWSPNYSWNDNGDNFINLNLYGIPIAYVPDYDLSLYLIQTSILQQHVQEGTDDVEQNSDIMAQFNYYMGPDTTSGGAPVTSKDCLGWRNAGTTTTSSSSPSNTEWNPQCIPLGGQSIWAVAGSPEQQQQAQAKEIVMIATNIDTTSMFHELSPGANTAASNILTTVLAAMLIGSNINDATLDSYNKRIGFGFFQGDIFGYIGSRLFLKDLSSFQCFNQVNYTNVTTATTTTTATKSKSSPTPPSTYEPGENACLYPLRPSLAFTKLGNVATMICADQIGALQTNNTMYIHGSTADSSGVGQFVGNVMKQLSTSSAYIVDGSASSSNNNNNVIPVPPSPLVSLLKLSGGTVGGAVLAGYDSTFIQDGSYHSHVDSIHYKKEINLDAIAAAATVLARTAVAVAYDNGNQDYASSAAYAMNIIPTAMTSDDEILQSLAQCLYRDGKCNFLKQYYNVEYANQVKRTGSDPGLSYMPLGNPPNYYVSVLNVGQSLPYVQVGNNIYGAYSGSDYGKYTQDQIYLIPRQIEASILGLLNDFLGRGSFSNNGTTTSSSSRSRSNANEGKFVACTTTADCGGNSYCNQNGDYAVCSGGLVCVCSRAHYHLALDEALEPAPNNYTGYFIVRDDDEGISAMYTEPNWLSTVGVTVYREAGPEAGTYAIIAGGVTLAASVVASIALRATLSKSRLY